MFSIFKPKNKSKHHEFPSVNFKFIEANDSLQAPKIEFSARFTNNLQLGKQFASEMKKCHYDLRPYADSCYDLYSGIFDAEDGKEFLDILLAMKKIYGADFIIDKVEYEELLSALLQNDYINRASQDYFIEAMATDLTLPARRKLAQEKKDFKEAIALAKIYTEETDNQAMVLNWLINAIEYHPNGYEELQKHFDLNAFLHTCSKIKYAGQVLFERKSALPLLPALQNIVEELNFGFFFNRDSVNPRLADFIANSKTLKHLNLPGICTQTPWDRLNASHMKYLAEGLKHNTSLEFLSLVDQPIGDDGLILLLDALASNKNSNLRTLNIAGVYISSKGQQALEKFLETNTSIECINLYETSIDSRKIGSLLYRNKLAHAKTSDNSVAPTFGR